MNVPVLDVRDLTVQFKTDSGIVRAVNNISFQVPRGQTLGIVGESGSGKSVTALTIMDLVPSPPGEITQGEIYFCGAENVSAVNLRSLSPETLQKIRGSQVSMIFQEPMSSLNPVYTCGFQLTEAILQHQDISREAATQQAIARLQEVKLLPSDEELQAEIAAARPEWDADQQQ
jgi:peptide/nickel transport system ATP-binding protein